MPGPTIGQQFYELQLNIRKKKPLLKSLPIAFIRLVSGNTVTNWQKSSLWKQRYLEIARALATSPQLLILDEPSSGLNDKESEELMELLQSLIAEGFTILLIEHDMNVVMGVSDWIAVMDMGSKIAEGIPNNIYNHPVVIEAYLGKEEE